MGIAGVLQKTIVKISLYYLMICAIEHIIYKFGDSCFLLYILLSKYTVILIITFKHFLFY